MRGCRVPVIVKSIIFVVPMVISLVVSGCRGLSEGETEGESLLWAWPSRAEVETVTGDSPGWGRTAFFRFRDAPAEGSLQVEVKPGVPFRLEYAGQVIFVVILGDLDEPPYEVTLKNLEGEVLGKAYVGRPERESGEPFVSVGETRTWSGWDGLPRAEYRILAGKVKDEEVVIAGHGSVSVTITVPSDVSEGTLRDAVRFEPSEGAELTFRERTAIPQSGKTVGWRTLTVMWPGVENPAGVGKPAPVPPGFAPGMKVSVDAEKIPVFKDVSGSDGVFRISVSRSTPAECSVRSLDDASIKVPYDGFRAVYSLKPGPLRFLLTFTKPVNRGSVERALVSSVTRLQQGPVPTWLSFAWKSDRELECEITSLESQASGEVTYWLDVADSVDHEGILISFPQPMVVRLVSPRTLAEVLAEDPGGTMQTIVELPPGVNAAMLSPRGEFVVGFEPVAAEMGRESPAGYHMWLYSFSCGKWTDFGSSIRPVHNARWLDADSILTWDRAGWEIIQIPSGETKRVSWESESGLPLLGLCPSPDGKALAIVQGAMHRSQYDPADLFLCNLEGNVVRRWPKITGTNLDDFLRWFVPVFYTDWVRPATPSEGTPNAGAEQLSDGPSGTVFLVDRPRSGPTRILSVDVQSGAVSVVPGTEESPRATLAVFGTDPAYLVFGARSERICVVDLESGELVGPTKCNWLLGPDFTGQALLPSPDGRFLLAGSTLIDVQEFVSGGPAEGKNWPELPGSPAGWSPDGTRVYVLRWPQ